MKADTKSKKEGDIFEAKKEAYKPSEQRKKDQSEVDKQVSLSCLIARTRHLFGLSQPIFSV